MGKKKESVRTTVPNCDEQNSDKFRETVAKVVHGAVFVAGAVKPLVSHLAKTYSKLKILDKTVIAVEEGLRDADKQMNKTGDNNGS